MRPKRLLGGEMTQSRRFALSTLFAFFVLALPAQAFAAIKIHKIQFDPPGADNGSNNT